MSFDVQALEPKIRAILSAPGTDLATISAKRVRKELAERDPALTSDLLKEHKDQIDAIITRVYEEVSAARNGTAHSKSEDDDDEDASTTSAAAKRKRADASDNDDDEPAPAKPKKSKQKKELTDEELARQLSNEINGRQRASRTAASSKTKANGSKRGKKGPKSSATVASDGEAGDSDEEAKPKKRGGGFKKEYVLSEPLAALLKTDKLSRPQTVKQLWDHIKANNMQNPENKKEIICDDSFKAIFKCDRIDMFKMNKELGQHLHEPQPAS
ncbi:SWIB-domain-containing protein [Trametes cingulata]|nr:SWIB-domain-containing protein [Trametes cingulata]